MNGLIETINSRRSIRRFSQKTVERANIKEILRAAMNAPSACSQQIWQFVVLDDRAILDKLADMHSGISFLKKAPLAILVCGEPGAAVLDYFWEDDCAAATQNILLAAHALGLGATWSGVNRKTPDMADFIREAVGIPKEHVPFSIIVIGHPDEEKREKDRYNDEKVHDNGWDVKWCE